MTTKVLIIDPDIAFTVPIKHAVEQVGDYVVNVFASGQAAVEQLQRETYDIAILDFAVNDVPLPELIHALHEAQAGLPILVSSRLDENVAEWRRVMSSMDVQGSIITKPYYARQLVPVIRETVAHTRRVEPPVQPDDTFFRLIRALGGTEKPAPTAPETNAPRPEGTPSEPPVSEGSTIRELISGKPAHAASQPPDTIPEAPAAKQADDDAVPDEVAVVALDAARDDTIPMEQLSVQAVIARVDQEAGESNLTRPIPVWVASTAGDADQPTLVEPPVTIEDTQPSARVQVEKIVQKITADHTEPVGGVVQERLEAEPPSDVPPMLDEPSFVAQVIEESLPSLPLPEPAEPIVAPAPAGVPSVPPEPAAEPAPEPDPAAQLAVQLTQLTVDSTAQVTVLSRGGELVASAGQMPDKAVSSVVQSINTVWRGAGDEGNALVRYLNVTGIGDFLLYSIRTLDDMTLSMLFPAETSLHIIRHQARRLTRALEAVPETPPAGSAESDAMSARPTEPHPPTGLRAALTAEQQAATADLSVLSADSDLAATAKPSPVGALYAFVWLPRTGSLPPEIAGRLRDWVDASAADHAWKIEGLEIQPSYLTLQINIPASETPTVTVETLMGETAARANDPYLWADAYYIVASGRAVTPQEIANFMEYRREAEDAA